MKEKRPRRGRRCKLRDVQQKRSESRSSEQGKKKRGQNKRKEPRFRDNSRKSNISVTVKRCRRDARQRRSDRSKKRRDSRSYTTTNASEPKDITRSPLNLYPACIHPTTRPASMKAGGKKYKVLRHVRIVKMSGNICLNVPLVQNKPVRNAKASYVEICHVAQRSCLEENLRKGGAQARTIMVTTCRLASTRGQAVMA